MKKKTCLFTALLALSFCLSGSPLMAAGPVLDPRFPTNPPRFSASMSMAVMSTRATAAETTVVTTVNKDGKIIRQTVPAGPFGEQFYHSTLVSTYTVPTVPSNLFASEEGCNTGDYTISAKELYDRTVTVD